LFPRCTPVGDVSLGQATPNSEVTRDWTWTCNGKFVPQSYLDQGVFDPRNWVDGNACELIIGGKLAADCIATNATFSSQTVEHTPGGTRQTLERRLGFKIQVTTTEWVTRDSLLLQPFLDSLLSDVPLEVDLLIRMSGPSS
jgi:hypothetical protein